MSIFTGFFQYFSGKTKQKETLHESDIKFSALIQSIQSDIVEANQSLECVGIKYIEQFFDKEPEANLIERINQKLNVIEKVLDVGDSQTANNLLLDLKVDVNELSSSSAGKLANYRPKMTSFEMPVFKNGVWVSESISVPLLVLSPIPMPKIKELTFTSTVQRVQHEGEDIYVRLMQDDNASNKRNKRKKRNIQDEKVTELKISITPEQSSEELKDVITHYEQILRSN